MKILLDLYNGAYGETLLIKYYNQDNLDALCELFKNLADGILRMPKDGAVTLSGFDDMRFVIEDKRQGLKPCVTKAFIDGKLTLTWQGCPESWGTCYDLANSLCGKEEGHQYLTEENDGILVLLEK